MQHLVVPYGSRFLVCRRSEHGQLTAVSDHLVDRSANAEVAHLNAAAARDVIVLPVEPELRQIPFGFYTDEDAA